MVGEIRWSCVADGDVLVTISGTLEKNLFKVTRRRIAGSNVSVAMAANLHQATENWTLRNPLLSCSPESVFSGACRAADIIRVTLQYLIRYQLVPYQATDVNK